MATFTVTSLADVTDAADGVLTLREAAALANATAGADTIDFDTGAGGTIEGGGLIRLVQGTIGIADQITIDGGELIKVSGDTNGDDVLVAGTSHTDVIASIDPTNALTDGVDNDQDGLTDDADGDGETLLDDNVRILNLGAGSAGSTISGLMMTGGRAAGAYQDGGAIRATGDITINSSVFVGNSTAGAFGDGGAVFSNASIAVQGSTFTGNRVEGRSSEGGALYAYLTASVASSAFYSNQAIGNFTDGGAIFTLEALTIDDSLLSGNSVTGAYAGDGGGAASRDTLIITNSTVESNSAVFAGGLFSSNTMTIENTSVYGNTAVYNGGGIFARSDLNVTNSLFTYNQAGGNGGAIVGSANTVISGSEIANNQAASSGGGIFSRTVYLGVGTPPATLELDDSSVDSNTAGAYVNGATLRSGRGGGVYAETVSVSGSQITGNITNYSGGGVYARSVASLRDTTFDGNSVVYTPAAPANSSSGGGGVRAFVVAATNVTVSNNTTSTFYGSGGGIAAHGVNLTNTTVYGNSTSGDQASGGGIFASSFQLFQSTITGNSVSGSNADGGGLFTSAGTYTELTNSIVIGNRSVQGVNPELHLYNHFGGAFQYSGTNIIGTDIVSSGGVITGTTSAAQVFAQTLTQGGTIFGLLSDNGGAIQTVALLAGGDAVDAGDATLRPADLFDLDNDGDTTELILTDARGFFRPSGIDLDLGAIEVQQLAINGTNNADSLSGSNVSDSITGLDGNDLLNGLAAIDFIQGGAGNDTLNGGLGADMMDGGLGNDRFFVDDANDLVIEAAGEGTDLVSTSVDFTLPDNVEQGSTLGTGDVAITGNALANFITGNGGANVLRGLGGADRLIAGLGDDTLEGGEGNDILQGQGGADRFVVNANNGNDQILDWEAATDVLDFAEFGLRFAQLRITSSGNEALITFDDPAGSTGSVRLVDIDPEVLEIGIMADPGGVGSPGGIPLTAGTSGADNLAATNGDDDVVGLAGNDILNGRAGADTMVGGFGDDRYFLDNAGDLAVELQFQGTDQMDAAFSFTLSDHVERGAVLGGGAVDITGNGLGNFITGSALSNVLRGEDGRDRLIGFDGDDTLSGGLDNDVLEGGLGADVFVFQADSGIDLITDFEVGVDLIDVTALGIAFADITIIDGTLGARVIFDLVPGSVDLVTVQGVAAVDLRLTSFLGAPNDPIVGTEGNDVLFGTIEDDELQGLGGADLVDGRAGADTMLGGPGDDRYFVDDPGDVVTELAGEGTDTVTTSINFTLADNVENGNVQANAGISLTGNALDNALVGDVGNDTLNGLAGADNLQGFIGSDVIRGGTGDDVLRGGDQPDTFIFDLGDGADQILDFVIGEDEIDLSATGLAFGDLNITDSGSNAIIDYGGDTITVFNATAAQLDQNQFDFGP